MIKMKQNLNFGLKPFPKAQFEMNFKDQHLKTPEILAF